MENQDTPSLIITPSDTSTITVDIPVPTQVPSDNLQDPQPITEAPQTVPDSDPHLGRAESSGESIETQTALTGQIVQENKPVMGRPSKFNEGMITRAKEYYYSCLDGEMVMDKKGNRVRRMKMPLLEELARLCDVHGETLENWCKENDDFFETIKKIKELQKERIIQRGFSNTNPTFAIFMLKANHGMIETEKRILAGQQDAAPMSIQVTDYKGAQQIPAQAAQVIEEGSE